MPTPHAHPGAPPSPVAALWDGYCADPFVVRGEDGRYVMYGTTPHPLPGGRAFQVLVSDDLDHWEDAGGALVVSRPAPADAEYWAPEVAFADGRYWMYYSWAAGTPTTRSGWPSRTGPPGRSRTPATCSPPTCPSPSTRRPYRDADGGWWLFYATDLVAGDGRARCWPCSGCAT